MSELIDRQALKDYVSSLSTHPLNEWDTWGVLSAINKQPTIDAVEVVRCGECFKQPGCQFAQYQGNRGYCSLGEMRDA